MGLGRRVKPGEPGKTGTTERLVHLSDLGKCAKGGRGRLRGGADKRGAKWMAREPLQKPVKGEARSVATQQGDSEKVGDFACGRCWKKGVRAYLGGPEMWNCCANSMYSPEGIASVGNRAAAVWRVGWVQKFERLRRVSLKT
eukprot:GFKZ01002068.1.p2 GENE.GFKZ01002068.1~~GFKZ01002068.1.p2  ORF type:complete len:142 (+),score=7.01 GFKZ01002068.1:759-1184(+)